MKLQSALLATAMAALPLASVSAQAVNGPYVAGGAGLNIMQPESFTATAPPPAPAVSGTARPGLGPVFVMSLGWGFGNGFRAELEGSYRNNQGFNHLTGFGPGASLSAGEQKFGGMVNGLYDFVGIVPLAQPYVGLGLGYQAEKLSPSGGTSGFSAQTKGSLAYQAILGVAMPIAAVPGLALTGEYRFMGLAGDRSYSTGTAGSNFKSTSNYNHGILVGVRYALWAAPVAAPLMPMMDTGRNFLVFFDHNKSDLTPRAQQIIQQAASYSTSTKYTRIDVDGNADTSGNPGYNQGLSERRAQNVASRLVANGVPANAIAITANGDRKLLVPTGPGVREPQNRRVEIVYH